MTYYSAPQSTTPPAVCPQCGGNVILKTGRKQDGSTYRFHGCSNFREMGCRFTWRLPQQPAGAGGFNRAVSGLTQDAFTQGIGVLRGDIQKINMQLVPLLQKLMETLQRFESSDKVVFYPTGSGETKMIPTGEPSEEDYPPMGTDNEEVGLKDL